MRFTRRGSLGQFSNSGDTKQKVGNPDGVIPLSGVLGVFWKGASDPRLPRACVRVVRGTSLAGEPVDSD